MSDQTGSIRSELVDTAVGFLKNPKVASESIEKKREFLQKKGLTDNEIEYAFRIIPQKKEPTKEIIVPVNNHRQSSFLRRIVYDLIVAGFLGLALKMIQRWFQSKSSLKTNELHETIKNLQKTVQDMQTSITKLEQTADQLSTTTMNRSSSSSSLEEIKREVQTLKALCLSRSQFPSIPQITPSIPSWQLEAAKKAKDRLSSGTDGTTTTANKKSTDDSKEDSDSIIVVASENEKKSDDENHFSLSPSSESSSTDA